MFRFEFFNAAAWLLVCCAASAGCGTKQAPRVKVFPVAGQLHVDRLPAPGAEVYFEPSSPIDGLRTIPLAKVADDGSFAPGTYEEHDGLPAGSYDLFVSWPVVTVQQGEEQTGPDRLGGRYQKPRQPVAKVTVSDEATTVPTLELTSR